MRRGDREGVYKKQYYLKLGKGVLYSLSEYSSLPLSVTYWNKLGDRLSLLRQWKEASS